MSRIKSYFYTQGKFGKALRETLDTDNEYLYAQGRYKTKIKKEDLPKDYIKFKSRAIWYMTGYIKTSNVVDVAYKSMKLNHLFKDDYLHISYTDKLKLEKNSFGYEDYTNYDLCVCGNSIIPIILAIEKFSNIDTADVKSKVHEKVKWYRNHCKEDYVREFGEEDIDIFKYYKT